MPTTDYRINTESGDCGRPVIYHDKYVGSGGVFFILGEHAYGYTGRGLNGFTPFPPSSMFEAEVIDTVPFVSSYPASEFVEDPLARQFVKPILDTCKIDLSKFELKDISETTYET